MTFNSLSYAGFLPLVYLAFLVTPSGYRWLTLLAASYGFYASFDSPHLLVVLGLVTVISYLCGIMMEDGEETRRLRIFWRGSAACLLVLALLKYVPALSPAVRETVGLKSLLNTIGVSYFTFQAISYMADVYLGVQEPERHFGYYALYLAFFPKLLQGPIERAGHLLPQLRKSYRFDYEQVRTGLLLFAWGLFQKVVIADRISCLVNAVYDNIPASTSLSLILATYFFAVQIYCDFSGYTNMALGTARLFNLELSPNFNNPYIATSIADFWRRWHISFSRWILDYIFAPLQMQWRYWKKLGTACALLVTFLLSGIWHGARAGFVVWGLLHGTYLALSVYIGPLSKKVYRRLNLEGTLLLHLFQTFITFHLVCFGWIFFRANSLGDALAILQKMADLPLRGISILYLRNTIGGLGMTKADMAIAGLALSLAAAVGLSGFRTNDFARLFDCRSWLRWSFYVTLCLLVILLAKMEYVPYLYFQF